MGYYLLTEKECNTLTNNILSGLDAVRTRDEWICDEAVELLSDSLVILDDLQLYKHKQNEIKKMSDNKNDNASADEVIEEVQAEVKEASKTEESKEAKVEAVVAPTAENDPVEPSVA